MPSSSSTRPTPITRIWWPGFRQEGERFDELDHPNVVKVYGFDQKGKHRFIIFEFVDGMNLYQLMKMRGSLALERALKIVREAAAGLAEAHRLGIVHRDLKPENIMVRNQDNVVKVLDFGIAKDLNANLELTGLGMYIGTPAYSSARADPGGQTRSSRRYLLARGEPV